MPQNPGLTPEIQEAFAKRDEATPMLNQVSPGAPSSQGLPQPTPQGQMTQASAPSGPPALQCVLVSALDR